MKSGKALCTKVWGVFLYNLSKLGYSSVGRAPVLYTASPRFDSEYPDSGEMQSPEISLTPRQTPRQDNGGFDSLRAVYTCGHAPLCFVCDPLAFSGVFSPNR